MIKTVSILRKAKRFYEDIFEVSGECDHSVGICICQDRQDYKELTEHLKELEAILAFSRKITGE